MATTPARAASKWSRNLQASTSEIRAGVEAVTDSPMEKAADAVDKYAEGVRRAVESGKFVSRLRATPLSLWKSNTLDKGIQRIAAGAQAAEGKMEAFFTQLLPFQENLSRTVDAMPDVTLEDSIQRMTAWTRGMADFRRGD